MAHAESQRLGAGLRLLTCTNCSVLFCSVDTVTVQRVPDVRSERLTDWAWPTVNRGAFAAWPKKQQGGDECRSNAPEIDEVPVEKNQQD